MRRRIEKKYIISQADYRILSAYFDSLYQRDTHCLEEAYGITSLYYDTTDFKAYRDKAEGEFYKEKWRLRMYQDPQDVKLEKKVKEGQLTTKDISPFDSLDMPRELLVRVPKLLVKYDRLAYVGNNLRITLDSKIRFSKAFEWSDLFSDQHYQASEHEYVLEVKKDQEKDDHALQDIISKLRLRSSAFSKYSHGVELLYDV